MSMYKYTSRIALAAILIMAAALGACGGSSSESATAKQESGPVTLNVLTFNDYIPEDITKKFKEQTGNDLKITFITSNEDGIAKITSSPPGTYDIAFLTSPFIQGLIKAGKLEAIDHAAIPNLKNLYPEASELAYDPGNKYSVPYDWGTTGICYRTDLVGTTPMDTWDAVLTPPAELKGKVTALDEPRWLLQPALKKLGYSMNTTDPAELQQAVDLSITAKGTLLGYDAETFYTKLISGEAAVAQAWDGWCNYGIAENDKIAFVVPKEGSDLWVDALVIPKGSTHIKQAEAFMNLILDAQTGQWVVENILYKVPNKAAMELIDPALLLQYPSLAITPAELLQQEALLDLGPGQSAIADAVTKIKAG